MCIKRKLWKNLPKISRNFLEYLGKNLGIWNIFRKKLWRKIDRNWEEFWRNSEEIMNENLSEFYSNFVESPMISGIFKIKKIVGKFIGNWDETVVLFFWKIFSIYFSTVKKNHLKILEMLVTFSEKHLTFFTIYSKSFWNFAKNSHKFWWKLLIILYTFFQIYKKVQKIHSKFY